MFLFDFKLQHLWFPTQKNNTKSKAYFYDSMILWYHVLCIK